MLKSQLALQYFPHSEVHTALRQLMRWIHRCPTLLEELQATGYTNCSRNLTYRQVELIKQHLGAPEKMEIERRKMEN